MTEIVSVRFRPGGKQYYFDPAGLELAEGQNVIVETGKGLEYGTCVRRNTMVEDESVVQPLRPVVRAATQEDARTQYVDEAQTQSYYDKFLNEAMESMASVAALENAAAADGYTGLQQAGQGLGQQLHKALCEILQVADELFKPLALQVEIFLNAPYKLIQLAGVGVDIPRQIHYALRHLGQHHVQQDYNDRQGNQVDRHNGQHPLEAHILINLPRKEAHRCIEQICNTEAKASFYHFLSIPPLPAAGEGHSVSSIQYRCSQRPSSSITSFSKTPPFFTIVRAEAGLS